MVDLPPIRRLAAAGERGPPGTGDVRHDMAWGRPPPGGGGKRGRDTKVSLPLLTPQPFLWTRLPSVARLKARGPQMCLLLQGLALDRSGACRSANLTPCTEWPRTVMRGELRKVNSGHNSIPKSARRTEPSPRTPVSLHISDVSAQRKVRGVKRGQETILGVLSPFVSAARRRHSRPPKAANDHALRGRKVAFSGTPLYRRKILRLLTRKRKSTGESRCFAFRDEDQSKIHSSAFSSPQYFLRVSRIARGPRLSSLNMRTTVSPTPISNRLTPK